MRLESRAVRTGEEPEEHKRIGMLMGQEICLIIEQVSLNLFYWKKTSRRIFVVRGEINENTAYIQTRSFMARTLEVNGKACEAERKAKVVQ